VVDESFAAQPLLEDHRRPADSFPFEVNGYFDAVGDRDEGNSFIHPVVLPVEGHSPVNLAHSSPLAGNCKRHLFGLGYTTNREVAF
jgi:hypothetical protein